MVINYANVDAPRTYDILLPVLEAQSKNTETIQLAIWMPTEPVQLKLLLLKILPDNTTQM